jgi:hypothetical protein
MFDLRQDMLAESVNKARLQTIHIVQNDGLNAECSNLMNAIQENIRIR